ncbi:hypothetical protein ABEY48_05795 [Bacillus mycoides]|uniref:hypothetical protein n=1 Tax=Bacillus cereus group TaxID=86661 RepID=UPI0011A160F1|nr:hypothetical protein [Bacillus toyonensis]
MSKFTVSIILFLGIMIPLGENVSAESIEYIHEREQSSQLIMSAKELKKYRAVDPRRGLMGK